MTLLTPIIGGFGLFLIVIGLITSGVNGAVTMAALFALLTGLYTVLTNRPSWTKLAGRKMGLITVGVSVVALIVDGLIAPSTERTVPVTVAKQATPAIPEPTESASPSPTALPKPSASPSAAPDADLVDIETFVEVDGDPVAPQNQLAYDTTALALLETLPIKGCAPKTGYDRDQFGQAWADVDRNSCDTRNDMLNRDLTQIVHANSVPCKVQFGVLDVPYTGSVIPFRRGQETSIDVQIDHIVALSDAWQKGA